MKSELTFKEWKAVYLQRIAASGLLPELEDEIIELAHMEAQEEGKSAEEKAEEAIEELKRQ